MGNSKSFHHGNELVVREMPQNVRQLHFAVKSNDRETVNELVARGVNINFPFLCGSNPSIKDGNTPLIIAVSLNHTEMVEVLLRAGAYINKCDKNGCTPVFKAAFHGRPLLIELLAKAGADVNLADFQGQTPLFICVNNAIVHACRLAIMKLLAAGAIVDKCDRLGQAPIHMAAHWKLVDVLAVLVSARSDVNICDARGRTPLYVCVRSLTTKLYVEDLRHRMPCIVTLFRAHADMLNLVEWLLHKGPGIPAELLEPWPDFADWYKAQFVSPLSLANICRKAIQIRLCYCARVNAARAVMDSSSIPPTTIILYTRTVQSISKCFPSNQTFQRGQVPFSSTNEKCTEDRFRQDGLVEDVKKLPLPQKLCTFLSRKMFYREIASSSYVPEPFAALPTLINANPFRGS